MPVLPFASIADPGCPSGVFDVPRCFDEELSRERTSTYWTSQVVPT